MFVSRDLELPHFAARNKVDKEDKVDAEAQDAFTIIGDFDNTIDLQGALELFDVRPCVQYMF